MDKKSLIGLLLIGAMLIGYSIITRPSKEELAEQRRFADSVRQEQIKQQLEAERQLIERDSLPRVENEPEEPESVEQRATRELGSFGTAAVGTDQTIVLENQNLRLSISTLGGRIYTAELKDYTTHDGSPLYLFDGDSTRFNLQFFSQNRVIQTQDLYFVPQTDESYIMATEREQTLVMRLNAGEDQYIEYIYTLAPDAFRVDFDIRMQGMDELLGKNTSYIDLEWALALRQQEKGYKFENQYSGVYYKYHQDEVDHLSPRKNDAELSTRIEWVSYKQQFFSTVLRSKEYFPSATIHTEPREKESGYLKDCQASIRLPFDGALPIQEIPLEFHFLPNHYKTLKAMGNDFEDLVDLGWPIISWINKWFVINIFHFLETKIGNYGVIIIILTIFFKALVFPLSYRSTVSGVKMRVLRPQIDEINKKYSKDKAVEKQQATMALYKKVGVNPMGGCLPALLQMPIWLALFRFFPASIELRQQSFLWATDLSSYDSILNLPFEIPAYGDHISLFTLLMAISMMVTTKINMDQTATAQPMPGMKMMMYIMPVMMLVWFNSYASGLSFYYFVSNLISYLQQLVIKRSIDEEKVLAKLNAHQKKPKKKSGFQAR